MPIKISLQRTPLLTSASCSAYIQSVYLVKRFSDVKELSRSHIHRHRGRQLIKSFKTHNRKLETKQEERITGSVSAHLTFTSHFNNTENERVLK